MTNERASHLHFEDKYKLIGMSEKYPFKPARLADLGGNDLSKPWYVEYYVWDEKAEKLRRKRLMLAESTIRERYKMGKLAIAQINAKLEAGAVVNMRPRPKKHPIDGNSKIAESITFYIDFKQRYVKKRTYMSYFSDLNSLLKFLEEKNLDRLPLGQFNSDYAIQFLDSIIVEHSLSNRRRNNLKASISSFFSFFVTRKMIDENPFTGITKLKTKSSKHVPYTPEKFGKMKAAICESDPQLWLFICFIYFIFIRPGEELRRLRVRDIRQKTIVVMGEAAKNSQTEHIMIPAALEAIIVENNLRDLPEDYYIFSKNRRPGTHLLGKNNFYKRHLIFLKSMKFDQPHDLYGYKHTGVISLFLATQNIELIRKQCRHADIATTEKYLRDLGLFINYDEINKFPAI